MYRLIALLVAALLTSSLLGNPESLSAQGYPTDEHPAATVAYDLSLLEADGSFSALYDRMHPDAQAIIPREAVIGWYENEFAPQQPEPITVTWVELVEWTWPVTGVTYPDTAQVSFEQFFGDGSFVRELIHLVQDDAGEWRWFFGRSPEFVEAQIDRYASGDQAETTTDISPTLGSAQVSQSGCELVELYPGYPEYRGYITGLVGAGDHECLSDLEAMDPGFSRAREDAENLQAAQRLGLSGPMDVWTWENWMAVEAERGLPPTCYLCLLVENNQGPNSPGPESNGADLDPNDHRLLIGLSGSYFTGDTTTLYRLSQEHGLAPSAVLDAFPTDQHLRALASLLYGGQHLNATQMLEAYDELIEGLFTRDSSGSFRYLNTSALARSLFEHGGYLPTPGTAHPDVQVFMIFTGYEALCPYFAPDPLGDYCDRTQLRLIEAADAWELELISNPTLSFADYLRREGW